MKLEKLVGDRFKERPVDCPIDSHAIMLRGGYLKQVASGIFSQYMPLRRITQKIERIIREEMDAIDGQEVLFPVVLPAALWQESGRYDAINHELMRMTDRNNTPMVLGMTHEEACLQLVREYGQSYAKYPFMVYQIQTKFRDEARPRGGLIRVREFTMKDGYSFHTSQEDLEQYYAQCHKAYERIYARCGIPQVMSVASDSGMMGGKVAHEFMFLTPVGEDLLVICEKCDYRANIEAAENIVENQLVGNLDKLELVHTPNKKTIEDICAFLGTEKANSCKAVVYQRKADNSYIVVFMRGDLDLQETKLSRHLGCDIYPAAITEESGLCAGYLGPMELAKKVTVLFDASLKGQGNLVCGANKDEYHYKGFDISRDYGQVEFFDFAKILEGGICPNCREKGITLSRGIEVGNIFQLGTKYTESMSMIYTNAEGQEQYPIMGCYGIGVGRTAASICEAYHDDYGPIWPMSIAPWQVHLCALRSEEPEVAELANRLYRELQQAGVEVIFDDRVGVRPGFMFSDADLLGVPIRAVVSPKNLAEGLVEISTRDKSLAEKVSADTAVEYLKNLVKELKSKFV